MRHGSLFVLCCCFCWIFGFVGHTEYFSLQATYIDVSMIFGASKSEEVFFLGRDSNVFNKENNEKKATKTTNTNTKLRELKNRLFLLGKRRDTR